MKFSIYIFIGLFLNIQGLLMAQKGESVKERLLISSDIGGTDPDDNQSFTHFLMYSNLFNTEGLVSSPSYGNGNKLEILRMIDLYEKVLPKLSKHSLGFPSASYLRSICKQGKQGAAPYKGYSEATEGSNWIIKCAEEKSQKPLWVLVWGGLDDLAQALHDAPEIQSKIKVYWIGGPNKKWSANSYAFIAANFPNLWFIEVNSSYYGFFSDGLPEENLVNTDYYKKYISSKSPMATDFQHYYKGKIKMGDTPSLLYLMNGNPNIASKESWGGSFEKINRCTRNIFTRNTDLNDTISVYSVNEFHFKGPDIKISPDSACFTMAVTGNIGTQTWPGYYIGNGQYVVRYCPKQTETLFYTITSKIKGFENQFGSFVVNNNWPSKPKNSDYRLGANWCSDKADPKYFVGIWQGAATVMKWRDKALLDWSKRWTWLR